MKIIKGKDIISKRWSGGETSELFIYPEGSSYEKRQFSFRLSKATLEDKHSTFTKLPKVKRELMLLSGELQLVHQNKYNRYLHPFNSDRFNGSWHTESFGIAEDFNLMMLGNTEGYLQYISCDKSKQETVAADCDTIAFYCVNGQAKINSNIISKEDIAVISQPNLKLNLELSKNTKLILVRIWLNN